MIEKFLSEVTYVNHMSHESFDEQLNDVNKVETEKGILEYVVIEPERYSAKSAVLFVGGFGQGKDTYTDEMFNLCNEGRKVLYANPIRGFDTSEIDDLNSLGEKFNISDTVLAKANELETVLQNENLEEVDLIGHSQGALVLSVLALHRPELAKNIVLQCPEGLQGDISTPKFAEKLAYELIVQTVENIKEYIQGNTHPLAASAKAGKSFTKEFFRDVLWRLTTEVPGSAKVDIAPILKEIKASKEETGVGPHVTLLNAQNDNLFNPEMFEDGLEVNSSDAIKQTEDGSGPFQYIDSWAMYTRKGAGHNAPVTELPGLLSQVLDANDSV